MVISGYQVIVMGSFCGKVADVGVPAVHKKSGSATKGRTPNKRYFVAKLSIDAIYVLFERPP